MCTIYTFDSSIKEMMRAQIEADSCLNNDGWGLVLSRKDKGVMFRGSGMDHVELSYCLQVLDFDRAFVHQRMATRGATSVTNNHFWPCKEGKWLLAHNGVLQAPWKYRVDSHWMLDRVGRCYTPDECVIAPNEYANLIVVEVDTGSYWVHRAHGGGRLHTDGKGNFSTEKIAETWVPATAGWSSFVTPRKPVTYYKRGEYWVPRSCEDNPYYRYDDNYYGGCHHVAPAADSKKNWTETSKQQSLTYGGSLDDTTKSVGEPDADEDYTLVDDSKEVHRVCKSVEEFMREIGDTAGDQNEVIDDAFAVDDRDSRACDDLWAERRMGFHV